MRTLCGTILAATVVVTATGMADVSKVDSRYFADESGKTFVPIGCNICFPRMYVAGSSESRAECEEKFFGWLRAFAANGGNYTHRLRIWGLRGERTTLLWCRDKKNTWESELVRGDEPTAVSGEKIPFAGGFKCYLPWENRWMNVESGNVLPDFTRSMVVSIYDSNDAKPNSGKK